MTDTRRDPFITNDKPEKEEKKISASQEKIRNEIEKRKGRLTADEIRELYEKYKHDESIVDEIIRLDSKIYRKIREQAQKLARKILMKYNDGSKTLHEILAIMVKYKNRNKWSDSQFEEFRKVLSGMLTGRRALELEYNQNLTAYKSRINRALGAPMTWLWTSHFGDGLKIKDSEQGILAEILSLHQRSLIKHRAVFMQSLMYQDCSLVAMTGEYRREKHIATNHIHPIIACMFLPKFDIFEIYILYANFGNIIKARNDKKPILTEPDALLFYSITTDPNDVVCEVNSAIADLKNRYRVQIALWDSVLMLRNGNYYDDISINEFFTMLNNCRNNLYDNADVAYNQDEGAIMRKLMNVFSLRPTLIATKPIYTVAALAMGPWLGDFNSSMSSFPFDNRPIYTVTSISMITVQLPPYINDLSTNLEGKNLLDGLHQNQWLNQCGSGKSVLMPYEQSVIHSKETLIFYVNRRIPRITIKTFTNPLAFSQLPLTISSFEKLNPYPLHVPQNINIRSTEEMFQLRSVVAVTETEIKQGNVISNLITGCVGLIMKHRDLTSRMFDPIHYLYDPFGASLPVRHPDPAQPGYFTNKPISYIQPILTPPADETGGVINLSFFDRASRYGTIFIYAKPGGYNRNESIPL